ncbi:lipase member I-like isoform X1 [Spodoptera frugiperda]|uniref:Lipase member I-like isoform X1 n=1 Tax=Spodoptera frugiperda TaxID=7108 RepID=A0A9R0EM38_SPOFR|nr:lipase member I-like isoform X1 [Spodoptera frugiperda]
MYSVYLLCVLFVCEAVCMYSSKVLEGYPAGYLADCPGTETPPYISPTDLKQLTIYVQGKPSILWPKTKYNYYQMKEMAKDPWIDWRKPTMMYVGGFLDSPQYPFALSIGVVYKKLGYNVFLLDTNPFTTFAYAVAANNIRTIGKHVAEMLVTLTKYGLNPKKLELVGLSLGGHTMSFIAKHYKQQTGTKISRLTGLDPSGPCFRNLGPNDRLDESDADFVDVIDTNIDGYGMAAPVGHVNFYVNGGEFQPGDIFWAPCDVICSHIRAFTIWIAALLNPNSFIAMKCDSVQEARNKDCFDKNPPVTNIVGLNTDKNVHGIFYLATSNNFPYFMGLKGLKKEFEFFDSKLNLSKRTSLSYF